MDHLYYRENPDPNGMPIPCNSLEESGWGNADTRRVDQTELRNGLVISTVFLAMNHAFSQDSPPLVYETMVFDRNPGARPYSELDMDRYTTRQQAIDGHVAMFARWRNAKPPFDEWRTG